MQKLASALTAVTMLAGVAIATPANAAITITSVDGSAPFGAPATFQFDAPDARYNGPIYFSSMDGVRAQPAGSTGGFAAVGPSPNQSPTTLDLSGFGLISQISFLWGSVDTYNTLELLGTGFSSGATTTITGGTTGVMPATGNQTNANSNRLVTIAFSGADQAAVTGLRFTSSQQAFEFDNVNVTAAVPEPATWGMMILGFGMMGGVLRRRSTQVAFA